MLIKLAYKFCLFQICLTVSVTIASRTVSVKIASRVDIAILCCVTNQTCLQILIAIRLEVQEPY